VAREMLAEMEAGTLGKTEDLATAIQAVSLDSARLEAEHHRQPGDKSPAQIFLEEIRQIPLVLPPPLPPLEAPPTKKRGRVVESTVVAPELPPPLSVSASEAPVSSVEPEPAPIPLGTVTLVPLPVTQGGTSILAEAGVDMWASLRALVGVGGKKKKGGASRKK
ncbi:MAG TPA: hypothetical protein VHD63_20640, partial [Ktedonobacteraceae bacterium]|nr:hypothetical protein [Ktedonobacteraceae bacterium]